MVKFIELTKRNLKIYFRDLGAIFFSLLSMIIVIVLMVFFLGDMNIDSITGLLSNFPGRNIAEDKRNAELLVFAWTCAGILSINGVTVTLAAYAGMIKDRVSGKINSIFTSSASQFTIAASYVASAWMASVLVCVITLAIVEVIGFFKGMEFFSAADHFQLLGMIMLNSFVYSAVMYLLSHIAKTEGAWGGIGTVAGTLVGFLGGIYIPIGQLSGAVGTVMKSTPVIYGTSMFRKIMTGPVLRDTFQGVQQELVEEYRVVMGIDLTVLGCDMTIMREWLLLLACGMIFLMSGATVLWKSKKTDR